MANLEFREYFQDGSTTHFKKMIQAGLYAHGSERVRAELIHTFGYKHVPSVANKELSLRNDTKGRWHGGKMIHFTQGGVQFAPAVTAKIGFLKINCNREKGILLMWLDDWKLSEKNIASLIRHDGFDDTLAFVDYHFPSSSNEHHKTLITWTNLKL